VNILLTNDDGIHAKGLLALAGHLSKSDNLLVVAPLHEASGVSHSFTIFNPLQVREAPLNGFGRGYTVNGSPSDCVKMGVRKLAVHPLDLIVSGINHGENTGISSFYSGTVAGAREGVFFGVRSISVSLSLFTDEHIEHAAAWTARFVAAIRDNRLDFDPRRTFLNINFPSCKPQDIHGVKITRQGITPFNDDYEERTSPGGQRYFWLFGDRPSHAGPDTDEKAIEERWITVTPLSVDMTDTEAFGRLTGREREINELLNT